MVVVGIQLGAGPASSVTLQDELRDLAKQVLADARNHYNVDKGASAQQLMSIMATRIEDSPWTNTGLGSELTLSRNVECDATCLLLQNGKKLTASVGAMPDIKNPVQACQKMIEQQKHLAPLERARPVFLAGEAAKEAADRAGLPSSNLRTPRAEKAWKYWSDKINGQGTSEVCENAETQPYTDTIGVFVVFDKANVACCSSSGGILLKETGRIGPAAIAGAGIDLQVKGPDATSVCLCSGFGEDIMSTQLARQACDADTSLDDLPGWMQEHHHLQRQPYFGVLRVQVDDVVSCEYFHSTESMVLAVGTLESPDNDRIVVSRGANSQGGWRFPVLN